MQFRTALAIAVLAGVPVDAGERLTAKEVRKAEGQAKTAADHLRLAAWYRSEARQAQADLAEQEALVNSLSRNPEMTTRSKTPNPLWNAQTWARIYRDKLQKATKLAAAHQRMTESLP